MRGKRLLRNTVILTAASVLLRLAGLLFQIFISKKMGAAGVGLYALVLSVNGFAATVAISGSRFATTRLVAEELGSGRTDTVRSAVRFCMLYALFFGALASAALSASASFIGTRLIRDARTVFPLRLLALSLPFVSVGAVLGGYFMAVSRVSRSALGAVMEQVFKIGISAVLLSLVPADDTEMMCASVVMGGVLGECLSCLLLYALYRADRRRYPSGRGKRGLAGRMVAIAAPLGAAAYARTALSMAQNLLVPRGLKQAGRSAERSLADYGTIQGMVFPVITFPAVLFSAVSELMVPEMTEEQMKGDRRRIREASSRILRLCLLFSVGVTGGLVCFSEALGTVIYANADVGRYIRLLAFLMPVMYMDTVTDGMLRGLGEHLYSMRLNVVDSLLSTAAVFLLLPRFAVEGYVFILYASEIFNFAFSLARLRRRAGVAVGAGVLWRSAAASFSSCAVAALTVRLAGGAGNAAGLAAGIAWFALLYLTLLVLFGAVDGRDAAAARAVLRRG